MSGLDLDLPHYIDEQYRTFVEILDEVLRMPRQRRDDVVLSLRLLTTDEGRVCGVEGALVAAAIASIEIVSGAPERYGCDSCGRQFISDTAHRRHLRSDGCRSPEFGEADDPDEIALAFAARLRANARDWERRAHGETASRALAARKARGLSPSAPSVEADRPDLAARIRTMREAGSTYQAIADALNAEGVPTLRGGAMWRVSSVQTAAGYRRRRKR